MTRSRWFLPALSLALGVLVGAAEWIGGDLSGALISLVIMSGFGALVLLGGGSETIRGLRGDGRDERFRHIDERATAFTGLVLILAVLAAFVVEVAQGRDGRPFSLLGAVAGISYLLGVVVLRVRG